MAKKKKKAKKPAFTRTLDGIYGELGAGSGVRVSFLQTTLSPSQLDWTTLISNIQGSERWPVRDLFQREVDDHRVTNSLLPYLSDPHQIKFFNPLTLTLLPVESDRVLDGLPSMVEESELDEFGEPQDVLRYENFYRFRRDPDPEEGYGFVDWNEVKTKLVAIDGQHRLTALKRLKADPDRAASVDLAAWRIPVVILGFRSVEVEGNQPGSLLEAVRRIFVHINREAKQPNRARTILLTDESVNAIATQELLQRSHGNDVQPPAERNDDVLPLLFYDWRGEEEDGRRVPAPASVKSTEEVHDWISELILGPDFSPEQGSNLGIKPTSDLKHIYAYGQLPPRLTPQLRALLNEDFVPALAYVLENFVPYRAYCDKLCELEKRTCAQSDSGKHAFDLLRFGQHGAEQDQVEAVKELHKQLLSQISLLRLDILQHPLDLDIGLRGVMAAFGELRPYYRDQHGSSSWLTYSKWFVPLLNELYQRGWLEQAQDSLLSTHQRHIVADHAESVVNYRIADARNALGALVSLLIVHEDFTVNATDDDAYGSQFDMYSERIRTTVTAGYRKELRPELRKKFPDGGKPLTDAVRKAAEIAATKQMAKLEKAVREEP